ncbi:hypothetical protein L7F22_041214 [Adiantum nelumboides]|nr:hypothetical protein [Adiantum nelumboides]
MTPVTEYNVSSDSLTQVASRFDKPKMQKRAKAETLSVICYRDGERIEVINHMYIQLVRTRVIIEWKRYLHETPSAKNNYLSLIGVKISLLLNTFLQINPTVSLPTQKRVSDDRVSRESTPLGKPSSAQMDLSNSCRESVGNSQSIIHLTSEPTASFLTLSPFNLSRNNSIVDSRSGGCGGKIRPA